MLKDRRIFDGRRAGAAEDFLMLELKGLGREYPREGFDIGRRSGGGDILKHSSSEGVDDSTPAPNKKGSSFSALRDTVFVE